MLGSPPTVTAEFRHGWLLFSFGPPEDMLDGPLMRRGPAGGSPGGAGAKPAINHHAARTSSARASPTARPPSRPMDVTVRSSGRISGRALSSDDRVLVRGRRFRRTRARGRRPRGGGPRPEGAETAKGATCPPQPPPLPRRGRKYPWSSPCRAKNEPSSGGNDHTRGKSHE